MNKRLLVGLAVTGLMISGLASAETDKGTALVTPQPGIYWDPEFPGIGFGLEIHGETAFLAEFGYGPDGEPMWHVGQGTIESTVVTIPLLSFTGGTCLLCDAMFVFPDSEDTGRAIQIGFIGSARGVLTVDGSDASLDLQRLSLRDRQSEGTIAGMVFSMPDLSGRWLFTDEDGTFHVVTDLESAPSGISDSGLAYYRAPDGPWALACGSTIEGGFSCQFFDNPELDGQALFVAESNDISHERIMAEDVIGVRLR